MSKLLDLNAVVQCVKNIVEKSKCIVCDKVGEDHGRYACGHTGCSNCLSTSEPCFQCLTSPNYSSKVTTDNPLTERGKHALELLNVCQDSFNIDVYKRQRISDQLKLEKEIFPKCIQAPVKYFNKRKSFTSLSNKENKSPLFYPGEQISPPKKIKMDKYDSYVQHWLNSSEHFPRKAFSDLNVNQNINVLNNKVKNKLRTTRQSIKGANSFSIIGKPIDQQHTDSKRKRKSERNIENLNIKQNTKDENDESGIVIDDYEPDIICIEDSQSLAIDKDKLALLAVEAACNQQSAILLEPTESMELVDINKNNNTLSKVLHKTSITEHTGYTAKVPFYKKGYLSEVYKTCASNIVYNENKQVQTDFKTVSICIDNKDFITTINIKNIPDTNHTMTELGVQTDLREVTELPIKADSIRSVYSKEKDTIRSQDLFLDDLKFDIPSTQFEGKDPSTLQDTLVIEESDTDSNEETHVLSVTADVHRSYESVDYGILNKLDANNLALKRKRNRGLTPDSSNSSDKENCDPNRMKRKKNVKKNIFKK